MYDENNYNCKGGDKNIRGIIHIFHGMTEYIRRYDDFAEYFTKLGYIVCGIDLLGHGESSDKNLINVDNYNNWIDDEEELRSIVASRFNVDKNNYIVLGFSLGSFILRAYQLKYPNKSNNLIYIGTGCPKSSELKFAKLIMNLIPNKNKKSNLVYKMSFDSYNSKLKNKNEKNEKAAWLIKNENIRKNYLTDCKIASNMSANFFIQFINCMLYVDKFEDKNLKFNGNILFLSGSEDPVSNIENNGLNKVIYNYSNPKSNVSTYEIKGYRHDILHDECFEECFHIIENFLDKN